MTSSIPTPIEVRSALFQQQLARIASDWAPAPGQHSTAIEGVTLLRSDGETSCASTVYEPSLCFVIQGSKTVQLGDREIVYSPLSFMTNSVHLPVTGRLIDASPEHPYLAAKLNVDPQEVSDLVVELEHTGRQDAHQEDIECPDINCGLCVSTMDEGMLSSLTRLLGLLDTPRDIPVLAPLARREIIYRALVSDMGPRMRKFAAVDSQAHRISRVIATLKDRFSEPLRIRELADKVNMSESTLYHSFKQVTRMSPLQFQKQLRLHEARRLMLSEGLEAATASYRVGYESPSHFSREYSRLFGAPPRADVSRLRGQQARSPA